MVARLSPEWISQVGAVVLSGLSTASSAVITATDSILSALGKLQAQAVINAQALGNVGRNRILNPRFAIAQRGSGPWTTSGVFTADRWRTLFTGDSYNASLVSLADADRAALGDEYATQAMAFVITGTASGFSQFSQSMENVRVLSGKTVTLSFWAKATSALSLGAYFYQSFGTGGAPSGAVAVAPTTFALTTSWVRYSASVALPSAAGKTLGSNNDHATGLYFGFSAEPAAAAQCGVGVQSGTFWLWGVQVETGAVASPQEARPADLELLLCQRHCQVQSVLCAGYGAALGSTIYGQIPFAVTMRATPTPTYSAITYANASALATSSVSPSTLIVQATGPALGGPCSASASVLLSADL